MMEEIRDSGGKVDENGYVTLYHATSRQKADNIKQTGKMRAKEDGLFFSTRKDGEISGYGDTVLEFKIPVEKLNLDDVFDSEMHFRLPLKNRNTVTDVSEYLVNPGDVRYSLNDNAERTARQKALLEKIQVEKAQAKAQGKELSKAYTNTIMNSKLFTDTEKELELSGEDAMRDKVSEKESLYRAATRLEQDYDGTISDLESKSGWNGEELDTAMFVLQNKATESQNSGDYSSTRSWLSSIIKRATEEGRFIQAFAKYSRNTAEGIMLDAQRNVERAEEEHKGEIMGKTVKSKTLKKVEREVQKTQDAIQQAEQEALQGAESALEKIVQRGGKHPEQHCANVKPNATRESGR